MIGRLRAATLFATIVARERGIDSRCVGVVDAVMHGPNQRRSMHLLSESGQMFADWYARKAAGNWIEFAANFAGSFRLHVPHVEMTGSAVEKQHDAVIGFCRDRIAVGQQRPLTQQRRQSRRAELQHTTSRDFRDEMSELCGSHFGTPTILVRLTIKLAGDDYPIITLGLNASSG